MHCGIFRMTFGNYVLFNLLVAILVEGFSSERVEREQREKEEHEREKAREIASRAASRLELNNSPPQNKMITAGPSTKPKRKRSQQKPVTPTTPKPPLPPPAPIIITYIAPTPEVSQSFL